MSFDLKQIVGRTERLLAGEPCTVEILELLETAPGLEINHYQKTTGTFRKIKRSDVGRMIVRVQYPPPPGQHMGRSFWKFTDSVALPGQAVKDLSEEK